jgi:hypothetical protein
MVGLAQLLMKSPNRPSDPTLSPGSPGDRHRPRHRQHGSFQRSAGRIGGSNPKGHMKKLVVALLVVIPAAAAAIDMPPMFLAPNMDLPSSSLLGDAQRRLPPLVGDIQRLADSAPAPAMLMSHMPIISPKGEIDPKMVKVPDSSIDCALIIKSPEVAPAK